MSRLFWQMHVTLDGFMEGLHQELDHTALVEDSDFKKYVFEMLQATDHIVMGRKTHDLFAQFWPTSQLPETRMMNEIPKTVFSRSLTSSPWQNTRIAKGSLKSEIATIQSSVKKDVAVFGSGHLGSQIAALGLFDEFRLFVNPVVLGQGVPMFQGISGPIVMKLMKAQPMPSGLIALYYAPARPSQIS